MRASHERAPMPGSTGAKSVHTNRTKDTADVALFVDGDLVVIAGPRRGRPPIEVNAAIKGTAATWDSDRKVWTLPAIDAPAVVANMRQRGLVVAKQMHQWTITKDYRSADPLPECVQCATPYRRLGVVPRHCVRCGDRLELQVITTIDNITARKFTVCACGETVDGACLFCGSCGSAVAHG